MTSIRQFLKTFYEWAKTLALVLLVAFLVRYFVLQPFVVEGSSMEPTLHSKQYVLVDKLNYRVRPPKRGEIIVFRFPGSPSLNYIKRIVGLPGETVEIKSGRVYINNNLLTEPYLNGNKTLISENLTTNFQKTIEPNEYFVLGDNRSHSSDSREWGVFPQTNIIGRAFLSVYPFDMAGLIAVPSYAF
ncbi:signal peptidase I [Candidatus Berkelbacteria bacterium]|nr:signal peptidase I [Candidatus Berkelbacteria bacterium]